MTPRMVVGIFVIAVENTPTDRAAGQQQLDEMLQKHPRRPPPPPPRPPPPPGRPPRRAAPPPPPLPAMSLGACRCCCRGGTLANGWRRPGPQPPEGEFRHRSLVPDEMVREVSEDGWGKASGGGVGGRRQAPMAVRLVPSVVGSGVRVATRQWSLVAPVSDWGHRRAFSRSCRWRVSWGRGSA